MKLNRFRSCARSSAFLFAASMAFMAIASDEAVYIIPKDLVRKAQKEDCHQVRDFYDRAGFVGPAHSAWGDVSGGQGAILFWCQRQSPQGVEYFLLIENQGSQSPFAGCPTKIRTINYPGGLSVRREQKLALDKFVVLRNPKKHGPNVRMSKPAIFSEYDGTEEIFYCHEGEWLALVRH